VAALKPVREALTPAWAYSSGSYMDETYIIDINRSLPGDWQELRGQRSTANNPVPAGQESFVKRFDGTEEGLLHLEKSRCTSRVTSPHVRGKSNYLLHEADHTHPTLAVWSGNESLGISDLAVERSAFCASIPMFGTVESLNPGTTTGIVLHEISQQRRIYQQRFKRHSQPRNGDRRRRLTVRAH